MLIQLAAVTFNKVITENELVLVDFWAEWCPPCRMLGPVLKTLSETQDEVVIAKIDIDDVPEIAQRFSVTSIPTMILFKNGQEVARSTGFKPLPAVQAFINNNK
jgi:thioredoxin 1